MAERKYVSLIFLSLIGMLLVTIGTISGGMGYTLSILMFGLVWLFFSKLVSHYSFSGFITASAIGITSVATHLTISVLLDRSFNDLGSVISAFCLPLPGIAIGLLSSSQTGTKCEVCDRRVNRNSMVRCPRCHLSVCMDNCWKRMDLRCVWCFDKRVPLLPSDPSWWEANLGPMSRRGTCQSCLQHAPEVPLHPCKKCRFLYCETCWDDQNGLCLNQSCKWRIEAVPASVASHLSADSNRRSRRRINQ